MRLRFTRSKDLVFETWSHKQVDDKSVNLILVININPLNASVTLI